MNRGYAAQRAPVQPPKAGRLSTLVFLLALGWRTWTRSGWLQATVVAVLPSVVVFGIMALLA